ncbi:MAG: tryptophan synthase subunit alpha [Spirochaetales bacterium]|nr:tryptophan synthase subunit alpha [Spirochaetales bacterium]
MKNRLVCHLIANYPDFDQSLKIAEALAEGGAESIEVQFPFSDPSADGPYILKACDEAIKAGFTVDKGFSLVENIIRKTGLEVYIMSYANILLTMGIENFVKKSKAIGVRGLIIPDLTLNNDDGLLNAGGKYGISIIPVVTLTTPLIRVNEILSREPEYIYAVLRKGITGESTAITEENITFLEYLSGKGVRILGGFGINSREQVKTLAPHLYASVAGTVFVKKIEEDGENLSLSLKNLVASLISDEQ